MSKKPNYFNRFISILQELHKRYPNRSLTTHLIGVFSDYQSIDSIWGLSDKESLFLIEKYQTNVELENFIPNSDKELEKIIEEGKNIDKINLYDDEEEEDELWQ